MTYNPNPGPSQSEIVQYPELYAINRIRAMAAPNGNGNAIDLFGLSTAGNGGTISTVHDDKGIWIRRTSAATLNADAFVNFANQKRYDNYKRYVTRIRMGDDITLARTWIGLFSDDPLQSDAPALSLAGFLFNPALSANFLCRSDNGSGSPASTSSGVAVVANGVYDLEMIRGSGGTVSFYINGALVATHTVTKPADATSLEIYHGVTTLEAVAKRVDTLFISVDMVAGGPGFIE